MKRITALLIVLTMIFIGCGGGSKDTAKNDQKKSEPAKEVKKELKVTLKIGEEEISLSDALIRNDARTPADDSKKYSIYADKDEKDNMFHLTFKTTEPGAGKDPWCTIKGYEVKKTVVTVDELKTKKSTYGGKNVTDVKGSYLGELQKRDENGFPKGENIPFEGTFEK